MTNLDSDHKQMIAAFKRAAVQESHPVRQHMMQWIKAFENGVTDDNALVISIPAYKDDALVGYLVTTHSFGIAGTPVGHTEFQPVIPDDIGVGGADV